MLRPLTPSQATYFDAARSRPFRYDGAFERQYNGRVISHHETRVAQKRLDLVSQGQIELGVL